MIDLIQVREAVEHKTETVVAVKIVEQKGKKIFDPANEASLMLRMDHANIVRLLDHYESPTKIYMVMECLNGGSLFDHLMTNGPIVESTAKARFLECVVATEYLHSQKITHRDIKPENILLTTADIHSCICKITDFNLSTLISSSSKVLSSLVGTRAYRAPEVRIGKGYTKMVDNWSLGGVLYTMLSQCRPFPDDIKDESVYQNLIFPDTEWKDKSSDVKSLISQLLNVDPSERLALSLVRLDYCNSLFFNMPKENLFKLQKVQNAAARLVKKKRKRDSITATLAELHWLNVESRIIFKLILMVYKSINGLCSENLTLTYKQFNCRPEDFLLLETKMVKTGYGRRTFEYAGPRLWNALPLQVRTIDKIESFKCQLKTLLFRDTEGLKRRAFRYT